MVSVEWDNSMDINNTGNIEGSDESKKQEFIEMDIMNYVAGSESDYTNTLEQMEDDIPVGDNSIVDIAEEIVETEDASGVASKTQEYIEVEISTNIAGSDECSYTNAVEWTDEDIIVGENSTVGIAEEIVETENISVQNDEQNVPTDISNSEPDAVHKINPNYYMCTQCQRMRICSYSFENQGTKYLCNDVCLKYFKPLGGRKKPRCAVCLLIKKESIEVKIDEFLSQQVCSETCLKAYKLANNVIIDKCKGCKHFYVRAKGYLVVSDNNSESFCNMQCRINYHRKYLITCEWCKVQKYTHEIYQRVTSQGRLLIYCSPKCWTLDQLPACLLRTLGPVPCEVCNNMTLILYRLEVMHTYIKHFCSYECILGLKKKCRRLAAMIDKLKEPTLLVIDAPDFTYNGQLSISDKGELSFQKTNQTKEKSSNTTNKASIKVFSKEKNESTAPNTDSNNRVNILWKLLDPKLSKRIQVDLIRIDETAAWRQHYRRKRINVRLAGLYNDPPHEELHVPAKRTKQSNIRKAIRIQANTKTSASRRNKDISDKRDTTIDISNDSGSETLSAFSDEEIEPNDPSEILYENNLRTIKPPEPVPVALIKRVYTHKDRVVKKVELAEIDEVRRINKTILTAQVSPISVPNKQHGKTADTNYRISLLGNMKNPEVINDQVNRKGDIAKQPETFQSVLVTSIANQCKDKKETSKRKDNKPSSTNKEVGYNDIEVIEKSPQEFDMSNMMPKRKSKENDTLENPPSNMDQEDLDDVLKCTIIKKPYSKQKYFTPETDEQTQLYMVTAGDSLVVKDSEVTPIITDVCSLANPDDPYLVTTTSINDNQLPTHDQGSVSPNKQYNNKQIVTLKPLLLINPNTNKPFLAIHKIKPKLTRITGPTNTTGPNFPILKPIVPPIIRDYKPLNPPPMVPLIQMTAILKPSDTNSVSILNIPLITPASLNRDPLLQNMPRTGDVLKDELQTVAEEANEIRSLLSSSSVTSEEFRKTMDPSEKILRLDSSQPLWRPADDYLILTKKLLPCTLPTYWTSKKPYKQIIFPSKDKTTQENTTERSGKTAATIKVKSFAKLGDKAKPDILNQCNNYFKKFCDNPLQYALLFSVVMSIEECDVLIREGVTLYVLKESSGSIENLCVQDMPQNSSNTLLVRHTDAVLMRGMASNFKELNAINALYGKNQVYVFAAKKAGNNDLGDLEDHLRTHIVGLT